MEVYLIRHTTPDVQTGICYGQSDLMLKATFQEEALQVKGLLPDNLDDVVVYSSPLQRCLRLAKFLTCESINIDDRIQEINFGEWELKSWNSIPQKHLDIWMSDFVNEAPPGGESMIELRDRVVFWWQEMIEQRFDRVAVVTHAGVIRVLQTYINDLPLEKAFSGNKIEYGEVVRYLL